MPTVSLTPVPYFQGLDANGNPINGGKLFAYAAGTSTPQDTYTTAAGTTANANPVILDSAGRASVFLDVTLSYKLILAPANDTSPPTSPIWTQDNITAVPASQTIIPTGLVVGFAGTVVADEIQLGDANFKMSWVNTNDVRLQFDTGDVLSYDRVNNYWEFAIASTAFAKLNSDGLIISAGLVVGFTGTAPTADAVVVGDNSFGLLYTGAAPVTPRIFFDAGGDRIQYDRTANTMHFSIAGTDEAVISTSGLAITDGLIVGYSGTPEADKVLVGDAYFGLAYLTGTQPTLFFDANNNDYLEFVRADDIFKFWTAGTLRTTVSGFGLAGRLGTAVASAAAIVPTGNVFHVTGVTNITSITSTGIQSGMMITIIFDGVLTFTDGSNLVLAGNFVTSADDTITLVYDGTNWYEVARSAN